MKNNTLFVSTAALAALSACTYQNYQGEAGLRRSFPPPQCGTIAGLAFVRDNYRAQVNPDIDEGLFAELGYCVPPMLREKVAFAAAYHHGSFAFHPTTERREKGSVTTWEVAADAPDIPTDPRAWLHALQDADNNGDGWIFPEEVASLEERTRSLMWNEQVRSGHYCQQARYTHGKGGRRTYETGIRPVKGITLKNCPYKPDIRR